MICRQKSFFWGGLLCTTLLSLSSASYGAIDAGTPEATTPPEAVSTAALTSQAEAAPALAPADTPAALTSAPPALGLSIPHPCQREERRMPTKSREKESDRLVRQLGNASIPSKELPCTLLGAYNAIKRFENSIPVELSSVAQESRGLIAQDLIESIAVAFLTPLVALPNTSPCTAKSCKKIAGLFKMARQAPNRSFYLFAQDFRNILKKQNLMGKNGRLYAQEEVYLGLAQKLLNMGRLNESQQLPILSPEMQVRICLTKIAHATLPYVDCLVSLYKEEYKAGLREQVREERRKREAIFAPSHRHCHGETSVKQSFMGFNISLTTSSSRAPFTKKTLSDSGTAEKKK